MGAHFVPLVALVDEARGFDEIRVVCILTQKNNIPIIRLQTLIETATFKR